MTDIVRTMYGETVMGMKVAGYRWETPIPIELQGSETMPSYASHWSTGPKDSVRLFTEPDVRNLIAELLATRKLDSKQIDLVQSIQVNQPE
jgi:hypothetical protein